MSSKAQVTQVAIYSSLLLSIAAYMDEAGTGDQASVIQKMIGGLSSAQNGPWKLTWGPSNNIGILAFVAQGADGSYTLALRGTLTDEAAAGIGLNVSEDLDVTEQVPFPYPFSSGANVAQGSMIALASLVSATDPTTDLCLMEYLRNIPVTTDETLTLNVTGHSLGADLANLASAWLADQYTKAAANNSTLVITPYTFAAPMTGDAGFATLWSGLFGNASYAAVNQYDVVPMAWTKQGIIDILASYANGPSLYYSDYWSIYFPLEGIQSSLDSQDPYPYVNLQPSQQFNFAGPDPSQWGTTSDNWTGVAGVEHSIGTYFWYVFGFNEDFGKELASKFGIADMETLLPSEKTGNAGSAPPGPPSAKPAGEPALPLTRSSVLIEKAALARWRATGPGWRSRMGRLLAKGPS